MKTLTGCLLLGFACAAAGLNLLNNPEFDVDLSGWQQPSPAHVVWVSLDIDDSLTSGSALTVNDSTEPNSEIVILRQCHLNSWPDYNMSVWVLIPAGQTTHGSVVLRRNVHLTSNDCSGGVHASAGWLLSQADDWQPLTLDADYQAGGSAEYILAIRKTESTGTFSAFLDRAKMEPEHIFVNGFEAVLPVR